MKKLIKELHQKAESSAFSGVVSIFQADTALYNEAFGYADVANLRKNNVATKFGIASGTKGFTALGIGALIDQSKLTLDSKIHDIFQQKLSWIDPHATIGHLLKHTSGVFDYYDEELITDFDNYFVDIPWYALDTPTDYLPLFDKNEAKFTPETRFSYSNGGYICLGVVIEKIAAQLYRKFIETNVFNAAHMADSGYYAFHMLPENTAFGYKLSENGRFQTNIYNLPIRGASDGGAYTTTFDLQKFWHAFSNNEILPPELTTLFSTPQVNINESLSYGYGLYLSQINDMDMMFLVGEDAGVGFQSRFIPEKELVINVLSNTTGGGSWVQDVVLDSLNR